MFTFKRKEKLLLLVGVMFMLLLFQLASYSNSDIASNYTDVTLKIYQTTTNTLSGLYSDDDKYFSNVEAEKDKLSDKDLKKLQEQELELQKEELKAKAEEAARQETEKLKAEAKKAKEREKQLQSQIEELKKEQEKENQLQNQIEELKKEQEKEKQLSSSIKDKLKIDIDYDDDDLLEIDILNGNKLFHRFFKKFFNVLKENKAGSPHPERMTIENGKPIIWRVMCIDATMVTLSENELLGFMDFTTEFIDDLKEKHANVVRSIPEKPPVEFYKGRGYIMVGGGKYSWFSLLSIQVLRRVGSTLPVEVMIPDDSEFEEEICNVIFPMYNAKCILMTTIFNKDNLRNFDLSGYQFKSFALLASSFDDTFLLDSDTFPVINPDPLFDSELYKHYGMITWPDFWRRTTSPKYYEIAGIDVKNNVVRHLNDFYTDTKYITSEEQLKDVKGSIPFHDREGTLPDWTTESGELLIKKSTHFNSLLLSLYYNFDGPQSYHPLLSQGGAGEGDKETFVAAAHYYNQPFYQLYKAPDRIYGWHKRSTGAWEHTTIAQYDPLHDFEILQENVKRVNSEIDANKDGFSYVYEYSYRFPWTPENCRPMFYHVHDPKIDPFFIRRDKVNLDLEDRHMRNLGDVLPITGFDLELTIYENMKENLCVKKWKFDVFEKEDMSLLCGEDAKYFNEIIEFLSESNKEILIDHKKKNKLGLSDEEEDFENARKKKMNKEELNQLSDIIFEKADQDKEFEKSDVEGEDINAELSKEGAIAEELKDEEKAKNEGEAKKEGEEIKESEGEKKD